MMPALSYTERCLTAERVMNALKNDFEAYRYEGRFEIRDGCLRLPAPEAPGTWVRIRGSRFSDGVRQLLEEPVFSQDECFEGTVRVLNVPQGFIDLCERIQAHTAQSSARAESFGPYRIGPGCEKSWMHTFAAELACYRRMFED